MEHWWLGISLVEWNDEYDVQFYLQDRDIADLPGIMYTMTCPSLISSWNMSFIMVWKVAGEFVSPKNMTMKGNKQYLNWIDNLEARQKKEF